MITDSANSGESPRDRRRKAKPPAGGVRKLVLDRATELRINIADLSRASGRNVTYMHQFIYKGTPKRLAEDTRKAIAAILKLPEDDLRDQPRAPTAMWQRVKAPSVPANMASLGANLVPLFFEDQMVNPTQALSTTQAMPAKVGHADFALWIKAPHGRVRAGDVAYVQRAHPTRVGDQVVVLKGESIYSIGELAAISPDGVTIANDGVSQHLVGGELSVLKIIGISFP